MNVRPAWHVIAALLIAAGSLAVPSTARAAESVPLAVTLGPGSELWLEGTSTVHDFVCRSKEVAVELLRDPGAGHPADAAALMALIRSSAVRGVQVQVPVLSLRSNKDALDKNLRKAMRADEFPSVRFQLKDYVLPPAPAAGDTVRIEAKGSLAICGQEREVDLDARAYRSGDGVWLEGSETLRMSEYGIKPPTMMLGTLKVRDPITVKYRLFLIPKGEGTSSSPSHN